MSLRLAAASITLALCLTICLKWLPAGAEEPAAPKPAAEKPAPTLADLANGKVQIVDLTHALTSDSPFWPGDQYQPFELRTIATLEKNGVFSKAFSMPEHFGTHLDAPNHFEADQPDVSAIPPADLFAPGIVLDISMAAETDPDAMLTVEEITTFEREYGRIPDRAVVLLRTGWGQHWTQIERYRNQDAQGRMHFPGFSPAAAKFLVEERKVRGLGIDTLSIDRGLSRDFAVHHLVNAAGRYGLENVAQLDKLPARGFYLSIAPIKIKDGTGGPTRIFALLPQP